jgi:hypothetical protein
LLPKVERARHTRHVRPANLALKFLLELAAFASLAYWGWHVGNTVTGVVLAIAAPVAAIVVWGLFAAPRATRRLPLRWRAPLELGVFALAAIALFAAGQPALAVAFALVVAVNAIGLTLWRQWET